MSDKSKQWLTLPTWRISVFSSSSVKSSLLNANAFSSHSRLLNENTITGL
jgi:hypothetical protein